MARNAWEFCAIYRTTLLRGEPQKFILDHTKIELLPLLPRRWSVPIVHQRIGVKGKETTLSSQGELSIDPPEALIVVTAESTAEEPLETLDEVERRVDRAIASLGILLGSGIFEEQVYRGWTESRRGIMAQSWFRILPEIQVPVPTLKQQLPQIYGRLAGEVEKARRFDIMAKFYTRAMAMDPSEERFLLLWTVLEVFPMKGATNIRPIWTYLGQELGIVPEDVKRALHIGELYSNRCSLVHEGTLRIGRGGLRDLMSRVEDVAAEVMRLYSGAGYGGGLDRYFKKAT